MSRAWRENAPNSLSNRQPVNLRRRQHAVQVARALAACGRAGLFPSFCAKATNP